MKVSKLATIMALAGVMPCGLAVAQQGLQQPTSVQQTTYSYDSYYQEDEGAASAVQAAPPPPPAPDAGVGMGYPDGTAPTVACNGCGGGCGDACACGCPAAADDEPWRLFDCPHLECRNISIRGWLAQTATGNTTGDIWNGPVSFNDRAQYQLQQLYLLAERPVDTGGGGWDYGGRVDVLYGTDWRFTPARGLELDEDDFTSDFNSGLYGLAIPQFYGEVAVNDLRVRVGHFYTIIGYEVVTAPDNFFISHAYTMQYGEPFTHTGALAFYQIAERVSLIGGWHNGWDTFRDSNDDTGGFLGGVTLTDEEANSSLAFTITTSDEVTGNNVVPVANRWLYSIVYSEQLNENWKYVIQHDQGFQDEAFAGAASNDAEWYGINQYLFYNINDRWAAGVRSEWFRDDDGYRVNAVGNLANPNAFDNPANGPYVGDFYEVSLGLNYKPTANIISRPEIRYDWYEADNPGGPLPFGNNDDDDQMTYAVDLIVLF